MKRYKAIKGNTGIYLSKKIQIEKYYKKGFEIYEEDEEGNETCIMGAVKMLRSISSNEPEVERKKTGGLVIER